jgi:hypothetical protein
MRLGDHEIFFKQHYVGRGSLQFFLFCFVVGALFMGQYGVHLVLVWIQGIE